MEYEISPRLYMIPGMSIRDTCDKMGFAPEFVGPHLDSLIEKVAYSWILHPLHQLIVEEELELSIQ